MFTAVYAPRPDLDHAQSGFENEFLAEEYIKSRLCKGCLKEVELGYEEFEHDGEIHRHEITSPLQTSCGAEWFIISDADWREYIGSSSLDFGFLLKAAGYKQVNKDQQ